MRWLILLHRYLGIGLGWLLVAWCLSGIVMMYVPYPSVSADEYIASLPNLDLSDCCHLEIPAYRDRDSPLTEFSVEMLADQPVLRAGSDYGRGEVIGLTHGEVITDISASDAQRIAQRMMTASGSDGRLEYLGAIERDQWTVGAYRDGKPLYQFALNDADGNQWYVSSGSGELIQQSTAQERAWGWFGSVTHWLYPTLLREQVGLWSEVVIWSATLGAFLSVLGVYIGIVRFGHRPRGQWSPYRGLAAWHHCLGLLFGILTLTWLVSGLFSMNPWGLFAGSSARLEADRVNRSTLTWADAQSWLDELSAYEFAEDIARIESAPLSGQMYLLAYGRDGFRERISVDRMRKEPLREDALLTAAKRLVPGETVTAAELLFEEDAYYFNHHRTRPFPVYRVILGNEDATRYYLNARSGQLIGKIDASRRSYRWFFEGLHRLDFTALLRMRPLWDILMIVLLTGVTAVCITGTYMGMRYLFRRSTD